MPLKIPGFFSGKGYDYICLDREGKIQCSDSLERCYEIAARHNWGIAKITPIRFSVPEESWLFSEWDVADVEDLNRELERKLRKKQKSGGHR